MAHVRYQQTARMGNVAVQIERNENWAEDWTWRTVKLVGFFIGSVAVLFWIFQFGSWLGGRHIPLTTPTIAPVVVADPVRPAGGGGTGRSAPSTPTIIKVDPIKVEVTTPLPLPIVSAPFKFNLPPNQW